VHITGRTFDGESDNLSSVVIVYEHVFGPLIRFGGRLVAQVEGQGVGIREVQNLHGRNPRSKKAVWTVSPSGSVTTRRARFPNSGIMPQCRMRPFGSTVCRRG